MQFLKLVAVTGAVLLLAAGCGGGQSGSGQQMDNAAQSAKDAAGQARRLRSRPARLPARLPMLHRVLPAGGRRLHRARRVPLQGLLRRRPTRHRAPRAQLRMPPRARPMRPRRWKRSRSPKLTSALASEGHASKRAGQVPAFFVPANHARRRRGRRVRANAAVLQDVLRHCFDVNAMGMPRRLRGDQIAAGKWASSAKRGITCQWRWGTWLPEKARLIFVGAIMLRSTPLSREHDRQQVRRRCSRCSGRSSR